MSVTAPQSRHLALMAFVLFAVLVLWTQAQPFASLSDYGVLDDPTRSSALRRNLTLLILAVALVAVVRAGQWPRFWGAVTPGLVLILVWFALMSLVSASPGLALNRLVLASVVIVIALCLPLLFARMDDFATLLGLAASLAVALCFLGAIFAPDLAIHSLRDTVEQGLAGDWRGIFRHKNDLAPMTIHFTLIGLLLWRLRRRLWGGLLMVGALALLWLSGGKSAALLLLPAALGASVIVRSGHRTAAIVVLLLVGGLALLTIGAVAFPIVMAVTSHLPDPSFTGRTDIWNLTLEAIARRPWTGYGYAVFWDTGVTYAVAGSGDTAAQVSHAHNGYLDTAISAGIPGLLMVLGWTIWAPLRHIAAIKRRGLDSRSGAFLDYLVSAWLFTLLISSLEAVLFNRGDSMWFTGLLAMVCLRMWARSDLTT